jgi:UDP-N-acetyl-D-mannosaminuronic acid dehydrogenase
MKKKISVIGLGYIGLPTATLLAQVNSYIVTGVDKSKTRLNNLRNFNINLFEKSLNYLINNSVKKNKILLSEKVKKSDFFIICVPTPFFLKNKKPKANLKYVETVMREILKVLKKGDTIILESTVPVGTSEKIFKKIISHGFKNNEINFAYCPERVLPGNILNELLYNDRIVGGINSKSRKVVKNLYKKFTKSTIYESDPSTAEMSKLAENSFRDTNIAFANELSMICDHHNLDTTKVISLANKHPRVNILNPGCGVGGHCIAIDSYFIIENAPNYSKLIKTSRDINNLKSDWVIKKIIKEINNFTSKVGRKPIIGFFGLGYKANSADLRESPALKIAKRLNKKYEIIFVDPYTQKIKNFKFVNLNYALRFADLIFILVNHDNFKKKILPQFYKKKKIINFDLQA